MGKKNKGKTHNKAIGKRGEDAAARYLQLQGYEILERNWACPAGEADIIALDGCVLVFIEVKTRASLAKGFPSDAVTPEKRRRYEKIALWFLKDSDFVDIPFRFDVIGIVPVDDDRASMRHFVNAFGAHSWA